MSSLGRIDSRRHPLVQACRTLAHDPGEETRVLLDGEHLLAEALDAGVSLEAVLTSDASNEIAQRAHAAGVPVYECAGPVIDAASPARTSSGMVAIARWTPAPLDVVLEWGRRNVRAGIVVGILDVQDPGNVGGIIRTADGLGASAVVVAGASANPCGWKVLRGSMGSVFRIPIARTSEEALLGDARRKGFTIAATVASGGDPISSFRLDGPLLALFGNEGAGLSASAIAESDRRISIPMRDLTNSLNVGATAAIVLWETARPK